MKSRRIATLLPGCLSALCLALGAQTHAEPLPNAQWRTAETTFFDLIQNGYGIVAVTSVAARSSGLPEDTTSCRRTTASSDAWRRAPPNPARRARPAVCGARNSSNLIASEAFSCRRNAPAAVDA